MLALPYIALLVFAAFHFGFAHAEIFDWENSATTRIKIPADEARHSARVAKNQGLSNAFFALGAVWAAVARYKLGADAALAPSLFFGACGLVAGIYGWNIFQAKGFLLKQALPGLAVLITAWIGRS